LSHRFSFAALRYSNALPIVIFLISTKIVFLMFFANE
jgi:hypothetical protein